ncbi:MAG TPA: class I SAM-dependent methyltransferase [Rhizomicrobium sp.]|jgi:cyclopropane fatty-acyl-phospholipid synthase-like methyltransferase|nr:class I SAM-dependent methyltransferase [Rhizomicrobium sp.]
MPRLTTNLHLEMLERARRRGRVPKDGLYGLHWGDPESPDNNALRAVRDHWLLAYVDPAKTALEIGPGGGRWTRYMLDFHRLYVVDYHAELLAEFRRNFPQPHIIEIQNNGTDFPGIPAGSVDFVFSFGVFVHLDLDIIQAYLANLRAVIHRKTQLVIQYADKDKPKARENRGFSDNDPRRMRQAVEESGYRIVEEDTGLLNHSAIMRFELA